MDRAQTPVKRSCKRTTLKGRPCKGNPVGGGDFCVAHLDEVAKGKLGFGGPQPGSGRPRNPRAVDVLRERIEAGIDEVLDPLWEALQAQRGIALNVKGGGMTIGYAPDHPTRIMAARELLDRGYGRPHQSSEITVITEDLIDQELRRLEAELASNDPARPGDSNGEDRALQGTTGAAS